MLELSETNNRTPLSNEFFCDGHCQVLTSSSLGDRGVTAQELSQTLFSGDEGKIIELLRKGVCFPVCFIGDCALDNNTIFVLGDLNEQEERDWIGRLSWKLNIPCGTLILCCGCDEYDLNQATSGQPPDENYVIFETIKVPPAEYLVEIYAFLSSMTVQVSLDVFDEKEGYREDEELKRWYQENRPGLDDVGYVIRLKPLETEPSLPKLEGGWFGEFEYRPSGV
jgi:hypothetical protein